MKSVLAVPMLAACAGIAFAQAPSRPDPAEASRRAPPPSYDSAFAGYRPYVDPEVSRWREANDEMGRLRGHLGHVPGSAPSRAAPAKATAGDRK